MKILDASEPEFGAPMTEDEVRHFLVNSKQLVHISTLDEKGETNIHPTCYYFDNNNDKIYIESGKESKKTRNLRKNNVIYYCVDDVSLRNDNISSTVISIGLELWCIAISVSTILFLTLV
jgi:nitroimidazol reductase NimA-like FMN-containing flavoprotein (pyridoxamine 5'-phosphate oxidase superfamily)